MCTGNRIVFEAIDLLRCTVRIYSFFFASALAVTVTFVAFGEQLNAFEKHSCKWSTTLSGHICSFTYSTTLPFDQLSVLPPHGTISGNFFFDEEGHLKFETVIG